MHKTPLFYPGVVLRAGILILQILIGATPSSRARDHPHPASTRSPTAGLRERRPGVFPEHGADGVCAVLPKCHDRYVGGADDDFPAAVASRACTSSVLDGRRNNGQQWSIERRGAVDTVLGYIPSGRTGEHGERGRRAVWMDHGGDLRLSGLLGALKECRVDEIRIRNERRWKTCVGPSERQ
jgi:hypothetical protein